MRALADVPMAGTMIQVAENIEGYVQLHAGEFTRDFAANLIGDGIMARRYAERGITDDGALKATYLVTRKGDDAAPSAV